ncbi:MAG: ATP-binding protein [Pseudomonadota bacterium]
MLPAGAPIDETVLGAAFVSSPFASFILDGEGQILVCNRRAERLFCPEDVRDTDLLRGMSFAHITALDADDVVPRLREGVVKGKAVFPMRSGTRLQTRAGTLFYMSLLCGADSQTRLYLLTQDQLKATADALCTINAQRIATRDELAHMQSQYFDVHQNMVAMEAFANTASHDLRTPLNTLSGLLHLVNTKFADDLPEKAREYLGYMSRAITQMDEMTSDFLEHARSASAELRTEAIDMKSFLSGVAQEMEPYLAAVDGEISVAGEDFEVLAEPKLLHMLTMNLLTNALKYRHPDRAPILSIRLAKTDGRDILSVRDNGRGFDPTQSAAIFQPFHRLHPDIDGSGVGLATCKEVCRRHGWSITAHSDGTNGAVFGVTIPKDAEMAHPSVMKTDVSKPAKFTT